MTAPILQRFSECAMKGRTANEMESPEPASAQLHSIHEYNAGIVQIGQLGVAV
jgi:hypothetical protein